MQDEITTIVALLTAVFEDPQKYRQLLRCRSTQAQQLVDLFQNLLDNDALEIDLNFRRNLIVAAQRLSKSAQCLPTCYSLGQIELVENDSVAAGSYADIYKARLRDIPVCMKVMRIFDESDVDEFSKEFATEAILWAQLSHPNLLPIYGLYTFKQRPCLVSPWMENKNINYFVKHHPDTNRLQLILDVAMGVEYLHTQDIIHGDLKGANVLVDDAGRARVADFGLSSVSGAGIPYWTTHSSVGSKGGSIRWQAPELFDISKDNIAHNSKASDVYAFASTAYEAITGNFPFHETARDAQVIQKVQKGAKPSRPPGNSPCWTLWGLKELVWSVLESCWDQNPQRRPLIHNIVKQLASEVTADDRPARVQGYLSALHFRRSFEGQPSGLSSSELNSIFDECTSSKDSLTDGIINGTNEIDLKSDNSDTDEMQQSRSSEQELVNPTRDANDEVAREALGVDNMKTRTGKRQRHRPSHSTFNKGATATPQVAAALQTTAKWDRKTLKYYFSLDPESPAAVDRKVKGLLNKLTIRNFDFISNQIITCANKSVREKDGRTLIQVIRLVFEQATDEAMWSQTYARLCRKMMERISPRVQDEGIRNLEGQPISGGQLFRKYLLNRCQEDFERGWVDKGNIVTSAITKAIEDQVANDRMEDGVKAVLYSDEYYAARKAKRQGLGLVIFIGELFKLQMLTERIMHECVKKLLGNVLDPGEEEIESLCKLLSTIGALIDTRKARAHMDVYFSRMKEIMKHPDVTPRLQFMLQDVIELRERKWVSRNGTTMQILEIALDIEEFFAVRDLDQMEGYFSQLSPVYHPEVVKKYTSHAIGAKKADAQLLAQFFSRAVTKDMCSADAFEEGFTLLSETIDDIVIDAPRALTLFAIIAKSAELDEKRKTRLASLSGNMEQLISLMS